MAGHAPAPIRALFDHLKANGYPDAQLSGIFANKPGYHNARHNLHGGDYSVQRADDRVGDGWAASALDITLRNPADMARLTQRLIDLTLAGDPAIQIMREFFGTVNGRTVVGLDVRDSCPPRPARWVSSDSSHLWHVHASLYRRFATDAHALNTLGHRITGSGAATAPPTTTPPKEGDWFDDMATRKDLEEVVSLELRRYFGSQEGQDRLMVGARTAALRPETRKAAVEDGNQAARQVLASQEGQDRIMVASRTAMMRPEVREARQEDVRAAITQMEESER